MREIIVLGAGFICSYLILSAFLPRQEKWGSRHLLVALMITVAVAGVLYHGILAWLQTRLLLRTLAGGAITAGIFAVAATFFTGSRRQKGFLLVTYFILLVLADILTPVICGWFRISFVDYVDDFYAVQNVSVTLQMVFCLVVKMLRQKRNPLMGSSKAYLVQLVVPLISIVVLIVAAVRTGGNYLEADMILSSGILLMDFALYLVFEYLEDVYQANQEYALKEQRHQLREDYYREMEAHQKEVRTIKHDLKNQLLAISGYLNQETVAGAQSGVMSQQKESAGAPKDVAAQQVESLIARLSETTRRDFTAHPGLNALLAAKYDQAQQNEILCDFTVQAPAELDFAEADLAAVVGNVLDNALEACRRAAAPRFIQLKLVYYNRSLILRCENSTDGRVADLNTRKTDSVNHGLGLASMEKIARRYHGDLLCTIEPHSFVIEITMFEENEK